MAPQLETIPIVLATTMQTAQWDVALPLDVAVQALIAKLIQNTALPFPEKDETGNMIPYRILWQKPNRYLRESETLRDAGVEPRDTLIMTQEARAGVRRAHPVGVS